MFAPALPPHPLTVERAPWLRGSLDVPADPAAAHFALAAAALAIGRTRIDGIPETEATSCVAAALRQLGARVDHEAGAWQVNGMGVTGLLEPGGPLDLTAAPDAVPVLLGLVAACDFPVTIQGPDGASRQQAEIVALLGALGGTITGDAARLPLSLHGPRLAVPLEMELPHANPAAKPALLLAALNARGTSRLHETQPGRPYPERILARLGARVSTIEDETGRRLEIDGLADLRGRPLTIPGDPSLAAMLATAAAVVPGSLLRIMRVLLDPPRIAILSALMAMGAGIELHDAREEAGERVADLLVRQTPLRANAFAPEHVALLAEHLPMLAAAAAVATGDSVFRLPPDMSMIRRARLADLAAGFRANGIEAGIAEDALVVRGNPAVPGGGRVITEGDAGIAMACLIVGMVAEQPVTIDDSRCIEARFPGFVARFEAVGASFPAAGGQDG